MPKTTDVREQLADYAHEAWSGWMRYLFGKCDFRDGEATIPAWAVERWQRQAATPYADLPESERESDRDEADKMLAITSQDADLTRLRAVNAAAGRLAGLLFITQFPSGEWAAFVPADNFAARVEAVRALQKALAAD